MVITASVAEYDNRHRDNRTPMSSVEEDDRDDDFMPPMASERSKDSLPNFSSLPCFNVKWGRRVQLRCVKEEDDGVDHYDFPHASSSSRRSSMTRSEFNLERKRRSTDDGGIEAMREKLMFDFREEVHQMQAAFLKKSDVVVSAETVVSSPPVEPRPWNLRTRRAVCKEPNNLHISSDRKPSFSPAKQSEVKSPASRNSAEVNGGDCSERPRAKFSGSLSKQEIEEDFLAMLGTRPARRPKKRPKIVQRQIDGVFPGFWLSEITADMYKVNEHPQA
ncbi:hypothetical protein SOVF_207790 [Spinacia oleracea]|uniref:DUF1639 domain-containing protein n=1 Tax=Spinacia oleracea TaxID=3562 RepID=A0A9R0JQ26_SPIOL|nr:uncharacterized protein LOC110782522 [Spinacia oleracea]KNA03576.1 hypothetical protein SOVF_207790 [Spinacia oleracea]